MQQTPDLTLYRLIHRGMRNDTARVAAALASMDRPDERRAGAMARWYGGFLTEFHGHHTVEDTIFFPALGALVAGFDGAVARIDREHAALNDALESLGQSLDALAKGTRWSTARGEAMRCATEASALLAEHLDFEDDEILPLFERHMSKEEYDVLGEAAMKHNSFKALLFAVPWLMSQTTPEEMTQMVAEAPMPLRMIWRATRGRYARLTTDALGEASGVEQRQLATTGKDVA